MKKNSLLILLLALSTYSYAQEIRTLFAKDSAKKTTYGGYGGPFIKATQMNKEWGILVGGKGGVIINQKFAFGGVGMGLVSLPNYIGDNLNGKTEATLSLGYGAGGIFFEYFFNLVNSIHFSVPLNVMVGGISISDNDANNGSNKEIESSSVFILEPGVNVEFNLSKNFITAVNVSYRFGLGSSLKTLEDNDIAGVNVGLVFKFGSF